MAKNYQPEVLEVLKTIDFDTTAYQIELNTNHGWILLDLLPDVAPGHCGNMIGLAKIGYYDGLIFHRIINGFMIQGGCPSGTGTGGPGYNISAEFNSTPHVEGVLSMARSSDPNSAGSQFFICLGAHTHLDNQYTAFGRTADDESLAVVRRIGSLPTDRQDRPETPAVIESAKVLESPVS
ncbi:MAG: peptidylprolyl isomerase [Fuerstiella sp.]